MTKIIYFKLHVLEIYFNQERVFFFITKLFDVMVLLTKSRFKWLFIQSRHLHVQFGLVHVNCA